MGLASCLEPFVVSQLPQTADLVLQVLWRTDAETCPILPPICKQTGETFRCARHSSELLAHDNFMHCSLSRGPLAPAIFDGHPWLMLALWGYLTGRNGLFLHGACCEMDGRFFLLLGDQQVGKSTLGRLVVAAGGACLTDENPFVTHEAHGFMAHGTPWPGVQGTPSALSAPLSAIFFLHHASSNTLRALDGPEAGQKLFRNNRFFTWIPETVPPALDLLNTLAGAVPIYSLGFVPDVSAVEKLREAL